MHRHTRSLLSISLVLFFALFFTLSVSPIPLGNQNGGEALADPGSGWEECFPEEVTGVRDVFPIDSSVVWITGVTSSSRGVAYRTENAGETWVKKFESPAQYGDYEIFALDKDTAWLYGVEHGPNDGCIYKTDDGGSTWSTILSGQGKWPLKLVALDDNNIWIIGSEVYFFPIDLNGTINAISVGFIERTSDGGANWVRQYAYQYYQDRNPKYWIPYQAFYNSFDLEVVDATTAWAIVYDRVIKTENWGWTWDIQLSEDTPFFPGRVTAVDSQTAWVALSGEIKKTSDGGTSWETQYTDEWGGIRDISAADDAVVWASLVDVRISSAGPVYSNGRPVKTINGGLSWSTQVTPGSYPLGCSEALDASTAWMAAFGGIVLKTTDGGDPRPDIVSVSPTSGAVDIEVTITGCDFGNTQDSSLAFFGAVQAAEYMSWSDTQIVAKVPAGVTGAVQVTVTTPQGTSNGKPFTVTTPILPPCGEGSGTAMLMLGLSLGLLSLAGMAGRRRRRT